MEDDIIGALWKTKSSKGLEYYSGTMNDIEIVAFMNEKKENEKSPDIVLKRKIKFSKSDKGSERGEKKNE